MCEVAVDKADGINGDCSEDVSEVYRKYHYSAPTQSFQCQPGKTEEKNWRFPAQQTRLLLGVITAGNLALARRLADSRQNTQLIRYPLQYGSRDGASWGPNYRYLMEKEDM